MEKKLSLLFLDWTVLGQSGQNRTHYKKRLRCLSSEVVFFDLNRSCCKIGQKHKEFKLQILYSGKMLFVKLIYFNL